jgi:hypothetical protein
VIKQANETLESDCEDFKLDWTLGASNNSFFRSCEIKMIEETTDLKQPKSYVERNIFLVESITVLDEVIDAVTPMKLPRTIVTCSTPETDTKALIL